MILIIDDDRDILDAMVFALGGTGYPIQTARHGAEALELLRRDPLPSLILLDLMMPVMDGWRFREAQLRDPRLADIPVIALSGAGKVEAQAASLGIDYLVKPVPLDRLIAAIEGVVSRPPVRS